jgi:hypothetical protein
VVSLNRDSEKVTDVPKIGQREVKAVFLNPEYDPMVDANFTSIDTLPFASIA